MCDSRRSSVHKLEDSDATASDRNTAKPRPLPQSMHDIQFCNSWADRAALVYRRGRSYIPPLTSSNTLQTLHTKRYIGPVACLEQSLSTTVSECLCCTFFPFLSFFHDYYGYKATACGGLGSFPTNQDLHDQSRARAQG